MSKKISLVLIMVMLVNMAAWAEDSDEGGVGIILAILAGVGLLFVILIATGTLAEADAPDDGIRLASLQNGEFVPKTGSGIFFNLLQYVEVDQAEKDKFYVGLRFRF
jgi:hypothetical protein